MQPWSMSVCFCLSLDGISLYGNILCRLIEFQVPSKFRGKGDNKEEFKEWKVAHVKGQSPPSGTTWKYKAL